MKEAILYSKNPDKSVNCFLCNRFCRIPEGGKGFCGVRKNIEGTLYSLNYGKAIAVAMDPIEKKPFYHFMPGTRALSFATVGCNFRCLYCFTPETAVINGHEPKFFEELFENSGRVIENGDGSVGLVSGRKTMTHTGSTKGIAKVFRHRYEGAIYRIQPRHAPPIECTPEHQIFVYENGKIAKKPAEALKKGDLLLVPKMSAPSKSSRVLDTAKILKRYSTFGKKSRKTSLAELRKILSMKNKGFSSRQVAARFGLHPTCVRKLWCQLERGGIGKKNLFYSIHLMEDGRLVHFKSEKGKGIAAKIKVDEALAQLLGYYCAKGSVSACAHRPRSFALIFSFGPHEKRLVGKTAALIRQKFGVLPFIVKRRTTLSVEARSSSLALLFKHLCGTGAKEKKIPSCLGSAGKKVIHSFLTAFVEGGGAIMKGNIAINTVSKKLALGIYYLFLRCGYLPDFYIRKPPRKKVIEGRSVNQSTLYHVKLKAKRFREAFLHPAKKFISKTGLISSPLGAKSVFEIRRRMSSPSACGVVSSTTFIPREKSENALKFRETLTHWLVPVFKVSKRKYDGYVYNMEVEGEHSYLANFVAVANCQNWDISQQRDNIAGEGIPPEKMVQLAEQENADGIAYTYTEPTIFMEYALDTAKLAKPKKMYNVFVTNGYMTPAAIREMKPLIDASRIDLKGFNQQIYTDVVGNARLEAVLQSIKELYKIMHIEVINLIIPGMNDSNDELHALSKWVYDLDKDIPVHFIGFYPSYKMMDVPATSLETLRRAREIALETGLHYAYTGNRTDVETESTYCYNCHALLVKRFGFAATEIRIGKDSKCPECGKRQYFVMDMEKYWKRK